MKAVFTTKIGSGYDDVVEERYHFPSTYLNQVRSAIGDLIVYYEPRRTLGMSSGGRESYFAMARVTDVQPDPRTEGHYYALIDSYLDFAEPVGFREGQSYFESGLQREDGNTNRGAFGRSVRNLSDEEFGAILRRGFGLYPSVRAPSLAGSTEFEEEPYDVVRKVIELSGTRPFRDQVFTRQIHQAYNRTCAVTGLQIINGGGRAEAQAAHIKPVAERGSDSVRNGLALSGTVHWMFDRHLISIDDEYRILVGPKGVPEQLRGLIRASAKLLLPREKNLWPHPHFLRYHRERFESREATLLRLPICTDGSATPTR